MRLRLFEVVLVVVGISTAPPWASDAGGVSGTATPLDRQVALEQRVDELESQLKLLMQEIEALKSLGNTCVCQEPVDESLRLPENRSERSIPFNGMLFWVLPATPAEVPGGPSQR